MSTVKNQLCVENGSTLIKTINKSSKIKFVNLELNAVNSTLVQQHISCTKVPISPGEKKRIFRAGKFQVFPHNLKI